MFGRRNHPQQLDPPPIAHSDTNAVEILRVWAVPGQAQQVSLQATYEDPGAWGLMLADLARAYEQDGHNPDQILDRIRQLFDAEWSNPTDEPKSVDEH